MPQIKYPIPKWFEKAKSLEYMLFSFSCSFFACFLYWLLTRTSMQLPEDIERFQGFGAYLGLHSSPEDPELKWPEDRLRIAELINNAETQKQFISSMETCRVDMIIADVLKMVILAARFVLTAIVRRQDKHELSGYLKYRRLLLLGIPIITCTLLSFTVAEVFSSKNDVIYPRFYPDEGRCVLYTFNERQQIRLKTEKINWIYLAAFLSLLEITHFLWIFKAILYIPTEQDMRELRNVLLNLWRSTQEGQSQVQPGDGAPTRSTVQDVDRASPTLTSDQINQYINDRVRTFWYDINDEISAPASCEKQKPECAICFQSFRQGEARKALDCQQHSKALHSFHGDCLRAKFLEKQECPMCRSNFSFEIKNYIQSRQANLQPRNLESSSSVGVQAAPAAERPQEDLELRVAESELQPREESPLLELSSLETNENQMH